MYCLFKQSVIRLTLTAGLLLKKAIKWKARLLSLVIFTFLCAINLIVYSISILAGTKKVQRSTDVMLKKGMLVSGELLTPTALSL